MALFREGFRINTGGSSGSEDKMNPLEFILTITFLRNGMSILVVSVALTWIFDNWYYIRKYGRGLSEIELGNVFSIVFVVLTTLYVLWLTPESCSC